MALGEGRSLGLLSALVALAAFHIAPLQTDGDRGRQRAMGHRITAIAHLRESVKREGGFSDVSGIIHSLLSKCACV